jgi:hypothetical protein
MKLAVLLSAVLLCAALTLLAKKEKKPKPPEVEVVSVVARRSPEGMELDGRVKNTGLKPIIKMRLVFDFFADERVPLTTQSAEIDEALLEPGDEATFRFAVKDIPRAVAYQVSAVDGNKRELEVAKGGPFTIE